MNNIKKLIIEIKENLRYLEIPPGYYRNTVIELIYITLSYPLSLEVTYKRYLFLCKRNE
jgi:hypothetical protein